MSHYVDFRRIVGSERKTAYKPAPVSALPRRTITTAMLSFDESACDGPCGQKADEAEPSKDIEIETSRERRKEDSMEAALRFGNVRTTVI